MKMDLKIKIILEIMIILKEKIIKFGIKNMIIKNFQNIIEI